MATDENGHLTVAIVQPQIPDLTPLLAIEDLHSLYLRCETLPDVSSLVGQANLRRLAIDLYQASEEPLAVEPIELDLFGEPQAQDLSSFSALPQLEELTLIGLGHVTMPSLAQMEKLQSLWLRGTTLASFEPLTHIGQFQALGINANIYDTQWLKPYLFLGLNSRAGLGSSRYLPSLAQLENCLELRTLSLPCSAGLDLAPLANLEKLETVQMRGSIVPDLAPLGGQEGLRITLYLSGRNAADLSPLAAATNLYELHLENVPATDLTPLADAQNLHALTLWGTEVSDLTPLAELSALENLVISGTPIADYRPLREMTQLKQLTLSDDFDDLTPLVGLQNLQMLHLRNASVTNLAALAELPSLRVFRMWSHPEALDSLPPLDQLEELELASMGSFQLPTLPANLRILSLSSNGEFELANVAKLAQLEELDLSYSQVSDLAPLAELVNLKRLNLAKTQAFNLTSLENLLQLEELSLRETAAFDLAPLAGAQRLNALDISKTQVEELSPLLELAELRSLKYTTGEIDQAELDRLHEARPECLLLPQADPYQGHCDSPAGLPK